MVGRIILVILCVSFLIVGCGETQIKQQSVRSEQVPDNKSTIKLEYGHAYVVINEPPRQVDNALRKVLDDSGIRIYNAGSENGYSSFLEAIFPDKKRMKITFYKAENGGVKMAIVIYKASMVELEQWAEGLVEKIEELLE